jgi:hypothetical protein
VTPPRRCYPNDLTDEERRAIDSLMRLARRWPDTLGLFSWSGALRVTDRSPEVLDAIDGGEGDVRTIDGLVAIPIPNDGGDPYELD